MRIVTWSIGIVVGLVFILFAVSNRQIVELGLWPLEGRIAVPLFLPILACAFSTFVLGGVIAWVSGSRWRRLARRRGRHVEELELRLRTLRERPAPSPAAVQPGPPALRQISGGRS